MKFESNISEHPLLAQFTVERALASIFWMDENGRIHFANDTAINQYGYSLKEFQRLSILDINPNFDEKRFSGVEVFISGASVRI